MILIHEPEIWWNMIEYDGIWRNMMEFDDTNDTVKYDEAWWNMMKYDIYDVAW